MTVRFTAAEQENTEVVNVSERDPLYLKKNKLGNNDIWALVSFVNKTFANAET